MGSRIGNLSSASSLGRTQPCSHPLPICLFSLRRFFFHVALSPVGISSLRPFVPPTEVLHHTHPPPPTSALFPIVVAPAARRCRLRGWRGCPHLVPRSWQGRGGCVEFGASRRAGERARAHPPPRARVSRPLPSSPVPSLPHTGRLPARPLPWWLSRSQPLLLLLLLSRRVSWLALPLLSPPASRRASLAAAARG